MYTFPDVFYPADTSMKIQGYDIYSCWIYLFCDYDFSVNLY